MLIHLAIRDFTLVDHLELDLTEGLTALTGETGAGKSILVDALVLLLGGRANADVVRPGQPRAEITGMFDLGRAPAVAERLAALELETDDGECIVRRVISSEGRSRAFINGRPVPVQTLRDLSQGVVEVHGQHAHHSLLRVDHQRDLLDALGGHESELSAVRTAYTSVRELTARREALLDAFEDREARLSYLTFQLEEMDGLAPKEGELDLLAADQRRLANAQEIVAACATLEVILGGGGGTPGDGTADAADAVGKGLAEAQRLSAFDPAFDEVARCLSNALIELEEAGRTVRGYAEALEISPERLRQVDERLAALHDLARKHRLPVHELGRRAEELRQEVERLSSVEEELQSIEVDLERSLTKYDKAATRLRNKREKSSPALSSAVTELLGTLGMGRAAFTVRITPLRGPDDDDSVQARTSHGADRVEFWVTTNIGHEPSPLSKIASGGELSRVSLALHVAGAARTGSATLVFDEVDVGIGGGVAAQIGRQLAALANDKQVLCITHLPQVAAFASQHLRVHKFETAGETRTSLDPVAGDERVEEIARMLGGIEITSRTLEHAREMLAMETRP